jgi:hypothetical protein
MTRRILDAVRGLLTPPADDVHFHSDGMHGEPSACYEGGCGRPRLDIG